MDAKPQRVRVRTDENAPLGLPGKTIHHRNKSTPALSSVLQTQHGANRNVPKRTAFGDVSNTTQQPRSTKDDISLAGKNIPLATTKVVGLAGEKVPLNLGLPAQRPISIANIRGLLNTVTSSKGVNADISKKPQVTDDAAQQLHQPRKVLSKRSTTIFKDPLPSVVEVKSDASHTEISKSGVATKQEVAYQASSVTLFKQPEMPVINEISPASDYSRADVVINDVSLPKKHQEPGSREPSGHKVEASVIPGPVDKETSPSLNDKAVTFYEIEQLDSQTQHKSVTELLNESADLAQARSEQIPLPSELEEYWDEEYEDNEEDDGYVTARSYRSKGDNTTGGATIVLFPKYNQKIKREIAQAKQIVEATRSPEDIEDEYWDTSMVAEYGDEIFDYMRELEIKMLPNAHYMDNQTEIQWSMRSVLMDWLVQVHHRFSLLPETLFLCVNYIDRFLSCKIVSLGKLQLVGATAIFIAAKYEEINCPSIQEIVYMVDGGYTVDEILKAERFMLSMLQFELGWPGPMSFLRRISKADDYDLETRTLAKYFLEITIMDERFVGSPPSFAAAGAHCLARMMLKKGTWSSAHVYYSNYTYAQLHPLVSLILECCGNPQKHHAAIFEKYTDRRFKRASLFVEAELSKGFHIPDISKEHVSF